MEGIRTMSTITLRLTDTEVQTLMEVLSASDEHEVLRKHIERAYVQQPLIEVVQDVAEYLPTGGELRVDTTYSGRGMYGDQCLSVIGDDDDLMGFWAELSAEYPEERATLGSPSKDNMGLGMVWYWPHVITRKGRGY